MEQFWGKPYAARVDLHPLVNLIQSGLDDRLSASHSLITPEPLQTTTPGDRTLSVQLKKSEQHGPRRSITTGRLRSCTTSTLLDANTQRNQGMDAPQRTKSWTTLRRSSHAAVHQPHSRTRPVRRSRGPRNQKPAPRHNWRPYEKETPGLHQPPRRYRRARRR